MNLINDYKKHWIHAKPVIFTKKLLRKERVILVKSKGSDEHCYIAHTDKKIDAEEIFKTVIHAMNNIEFYKALNKHRVIMAKGRNGNPIAYFIHKDEKELLEELDN